MLPWTASVMVFFASHAQAAPGASCPKPEWPRQALRYELEGVTTLRYAVGMDGRATSASVQKSSGWKMLDNAALSSLSRCILLDPTPAGVTVPAQYVWRLEGEEVLRPLLVAGSCKASERFGAFRNLDKSPANADGVVLLMLIKSDGGPWSVMAEASGMSPAVVEEAIAHIQSCRFAIDPDVPGKRTDATYGRLPLKSK